MLGNLFPTKPDEQIVDAVGQNGAAQTDATAQTPSVVGTTLTPSSREDMSVMTHLDQRSLLVFSSAKKESERIKQQFIEPEQLLFGLLYDREIYQLMDQFSLKATDIAREIQSQETEGSFSGQPTLSEQTKKIMERAYMTSKERNVDFIMPEDILMAVLSESSQTLEKFNLQSVTTDSVAKELEKSTKYKFGNKSFLLQFGVDITQQAANGALDPIAARDAEIERTIHILLRRTKNNPIIIGEAGVGKTAIVEGLAQMIADKKVPDVLANHKIIMLDIAALVAGASHRGEFEERLRNVIKEAQMSSGQIILFIDEIHTLIGAGDAGGSLDASNIIKPFLARGQLQIIGSTTSSEYRKYFEKDKAFERRFQAVFVSEPTDEQAVQMILAVKSKYEAFHHVHFSQDAITSAVSLSKRYIGERFLPDKAVDVLDEAAANVKLDVSSHKRESDEVTRQDVEKVMSSWTGIPLTKLTEDESAKLLKLEELIHKRLINQESAVKSIAEAVRRGRIGLAQSNRPIASFIFLGPTGVGKTELAKTLAEILFGKEEAIIRLDMSEYMEKHEVAKLIGAPPGYVGYEEGGQLTEAVRAKPYSVVLLDEIEKAHFDVFNILLQVLEDGRLTDNKGNTVSFKNTIIIATSNIASILIQQELLKKDKTDESITQVKGLVMNELHKFFKPELLNRFDEVIIFEPLQQKNMLEIAALQTQSLRKLLLDQQIALTLSQKSLDRLAQEGYDPVYGARPLRRLIQMAIENPVARFLIEKKFVAGDTILVDFNDQQQFTFTKGAPPTPVQNPTSQQ